MKKTLVFVTLITSLFLYSCNTSSEELVIEPEPTPPPKVKLPITISTNISRATDTEFENGDKVGLYVVNEPNALSTSANHADNICFTYSNDWTSSTTIYWKDDNTKADLYCYYPYTSTISNIEAYSFAVKTDQSSEANYKSSIFLWGKRTSVAPSKNAVNITLKHLMSSLIVKLVPGNGYAAEDINNAIVTISGLKNNSNINIATGAVTATGVVTDILSKKETDFYRALIVPQNITDTPLLKITIGENVYKLNQSINFESGKQYTCTINVERTTQGNRWLGEWRRI